VDHGELPEVVSRIALLRLFATVAGQFGGIAGMAQDIRAACFHLPANGRKLIGAERFSRQRKNVRILDIQVRAVELGKLTEPAFEKGTLPGRQRSLGEPLAADRVDFLMPQVGAAVIGLQGLDARERGVDLFGGALTEARKERFFFVPRMTGRSLLKIAEGGLQGAARFLGERAISGIVGDALQNAEEVFNAAMAILQQFKWLLEIGLVGGSELNMHDVLPSVKDNNSTAAEPGTI
jgi:hypothetical protein